MSSSPTVSPDEGNEPGQGGFSAMLALLQKTQTLQVSLLAQQEGKMNIMVDKFDELEQ